MAPNAEYLKNNLSVYSLSGEQLIYTLNATNDGYFEVCSKYLPGNHYYAVATGDVTFRGTESKEIQFSVAGENRTEMTLNSSVKMLESKDIYLILDADGKKCLLTAKEFAVGDNVAIYEKTEENILLIIKINAKDIVMEHNAYIFEVADYDKVFDKIDVSVSGGLRDCDFEINVNGVTHDIGYPSTVELSDGCFFTIFYAHKESGAPATILGQKWRFV